MKNDFLVGRFLSSHAGAYHHAPTIYGEGTHLNSDMLEKRFSERAGRFRAERQRYALRLQTGLALAVVLTIGAFSLDFRPPEAAPVRVESQEVVTLQEIIQTRQQTMPPPPPRPPVPVEVPDDTILEDDDLPLGEPLDLMLLTSAPPPPPPASKPVVDEDEIFLVVEEMPAIVGGQAALFAALTYPMIAQRAGLEGTVVVQVTIGPDGTASDPEILRSAHEVLDKTAVEAVLKQEFTPGRQRGRAVRVRMAIPVRFKLQG